MPFGIGGLRPARREPRGPADQDRGQRAPSRDRAAAPARRCRPRSSASTIPTARSTCCTRARSAAGTTASAARPRAWADFVAAWKALEAGFLANGGAGLAVLAPAVVLAHALPPRRGALRQRFPQLRWATWEPVSDENALAGVALAAGRPLRAELRPRRGAGDRQPRRRPAARRERRRRARPRLRRRPPARLGRATR